MNFLPLYLQAADSTAEAASQTTQLIMTGVMVVGLLAIMYFAVIRPQKKREKELKEQMEKLRVGDPVVTIGGIVGRVANIKDDVEISWFCDRWNDIVLISIIDSRSQFIHIRCNNYPCTVQSILEISNYFISCPR